MRKRRLELPFSSLPLDSEHPPYSAWGLWGNDDEIGTLNLLDGETVKASLKEVQTGERIPLNLSLDAFEQPMNPVRKPCEHRMIAKGHANDDELHINTQGSSHWDGLRHYPYQNTLQYYNGATQADISGPNANTKIGIQNLALHPLTARAVLLDWFHWATTNSIPHSPFSPFAIPLSHLLAVASAQNTSFRPGDILLIRTGWLSAYRSLAPSERTALPHRAERSSIGLEASEEMLRWHWECGFAAVASDTVAYERWPRDGRGNAGGVCLHEVLLSGWGCPIGESFDLEEVAGRCRERGDWSFLVVSVPLFVRGGVASPANAVAIL
ncbi:hypothetical protein BS50DRAFT_601950 [Corynespora cassiicola Philippines]|uniref:Cyclase n=1 Tax=Corynespora cassiicola Philippines TaxID=1448308 RepID=A0A2T2NJQ4_CORCC|nr:hypothetical protein BS50DRAFT_601950 [Corynespora cassiicola Philippines]